MTDPNTYNTYLSSPQASTTDAASLHDYGNYSHPYGSSISPSYNNVSTYPSSMYGHGRPTAPPSHYPPTAAPANYPYYNYPPPASSPYDYSHYHPQQSMSYTHSSANAHHQQQHQHLQQLPSQSPSPQQHQDQQHQHQYQQSKPQNVPYIGAPISLISINNVRYEGTLYTIDAKESSVALKDVRCFGSEENSNEFNSQYAGTYDFLIFRGTDIKDLHVMVADTQQQQQQQTQSHPQSQYPPTSSQPSLPMHPPQLQYDPNHLPSANASGSSSAPVPSTATVVPQNTSLESQSHSITSSSPTSTDSLTTTPLKMNETKENSSAQAITSNSTSTTETIGTSGGYVRFLSSSVVDDKRLTDPFSENGERPNIPVKYDKSKSFFDDLVPDRSETDRLNRRLQRQTDRETFGDTADSRGYGHGHRGGRGYRGGRHGGNSSHRHHQHQGNNYRRYNDGNNQTGQLSNQIQTKPPSNSNRDSIQRSKVPPEQQ